MDGQLVMDCIDAAHEAIGSHRNELAQLDQAIGDGDHVFNLLRGLEALEPIRPSIEGSDAASALNLVASKLLMTIGGSAGPLYSSMLAGMAEKLRASAQPVTTADMAAIFASGVALVQRRGKSGTGNKTMMDVLIPVSERLSELAHTACSAETILNQVPQEAERGMLATKAMVARFGRAAFLGERALGHIDPGARSCQLIIAATCEQLAKPRHCIARS
jgi:dihydroxyacetone kinase-like protein